jgi:demethoxyubiquinone hydroxylase (CLK1/Coq7/Cat5 family)
MMSNESPVIRPEVRIDNVRPLGRDYPQERRKQLRKALTTLHTNEVMAVNIYKAQISAKPCELNTQLAAAMFNEMTHMQDFQLKLYEYGFKPSRLRWAPWVAGYVFGFGSRLLGPRRILKTGIWAETKAIEHYGRLLKAADWDEETRSILEKDRADEVAHLERWESFLKNPDPICQSRPETGGSALDSNIAS